MSADLKSKNELVSELRATLRAARDQVDQLQLRLAELESLQQRSAASGNGSGPSEGASSSQDSEMPKKPITVSRGTQACDVQGGAPGAAAEPSSQASPAKSTPETEQALGAPAEPSSQARPAKSTPETEQKGTICVPSNSAREQAQERRRALLAGSRAGLLPKKQVLKIVTELVDARGQKVDADPDHLGEPMLNFVDAFFASRHGVGKIAKQNTNKFLCSTMHHSPASPIISLVARLIQFEEPVLGGVPANIFLESCRALTRMGISPTDERAELTQTQLVSLVRGVTTDAVVENVPFGAWWRKLRSQRGEYDGLMRLFAAIKIEQFARRCLARWKEKKAFEPLDPQKALGTTTKGKEAPMRMDGEACGEGHDPPLILAMHALVLLSEDLPALEAPMFKRFMRPLLTAADVDSSGLLDRSEVGALARSIYPRASERSIGSLWHELTVATAAQVDGADEDGRESNLVDVNDFDTCAEVIGRGGLRQMLRTCPLAASSPLFSTAGGDLPMPSFEPLDDNSESTVMRRTLLSSVGSVALEQVEAAWAERRQETLDVASNPKVSSDVRKALAARINAFEQTLSKTQVVLKGRGGGDEKHVAVAAYALQMLLDEAARAATGRASRKSTGGARG
jgi:hypothetical protein